MNDDTTPEHDPSADSGPDASQADAPAPSEHSAVARASAIAEMVDAPASSEPYQAAGRASPWGYVFFAGVVTLVSGLFWWWVEQDTSNVLRIWMFAGLVATLSPLFWHIVDVWEAVRSRRGAASGFVILTTILGIAALGIVSKVNMDKGKGVYTHDSTTTGKYTLGDATLKLLDEVPGTIYLTYLQQNPYDQGLRGPALDQIAVYGAMGERVAVEVLQPIRDKAAADSYLRSVGVTSTSSGETEDILVLSYAEPDREPVPGRHKEVRVEPYSWMKRSAVGETKWLGEQIISDAIMELVFERTKLYATGGHGERSIAEELRTIREALQGQSIEVVETPLTLRGESSIPDDCDILTILDPKAPFSPEEAASIREFLERGKTLLCALDVSRQGVRTTGLEPVLDAFGIYTRVNYVVIAPYKVSQGLVDQYQPNPLLIVRPQDYAEHPSTRALRARAGLATAFSESSFLEIEEDPEDGLEVEGIVFAPFVAELETPGFAARIDPMRTDYQSPDSATDVIGGQRALVAVATRPVQTRPGEPERDARVIVLGDADVLTDQIIRQVPPNLDLAMGLIQWGIRREGLVAVSARTIEQERVELKDYGKRVALAWPLGVALMALVAGGLVWWTRRR